MASTYMIKPPKTLNVSLTPELTQFIAFGVAAGRYQSASGVVRAGLRLLERDKAGWAARPAAVPGRGFDAQRALEDQRG